VSKILIACGGTGGHLAPGIAVAEVLESRGHECVLLISQKQVDSALIAKYSHLNFQRSPGRAFAGGIFARLTSFISLISGFRFARKQLKKESPHAVLLFGGFVSVGLGLAARLARIPVLLHEANCCPGKSIRLLKRIATRIYLPDGVKLPGVSAAVIRYFGYPVRQDIKHSLKADAWRRMGINVPNKLLVVIGGSQGATALNHWAISNFETLAKHGISLYCVTGLGKSSQSSIHQVDQYGEDIAATLVPFSDNMGDVISAADLVVSRAGAGSIAEIIRCRAPSILVPYPYAADDHQRANALMHERHGAGMLLEEGNIDQLTNEVLDLIFNDWLLAKFKSNLERLDSADAALRTAIDIEQICMAHQFIPSQEFKPVI